MGKSSLWHDILLFLTAWGHYFQSKSGKLLKTFNRWKSTIAGWLYFQRGRYSRPFIHSGMALLVLTGVTLGPKVVAENFPGMSEADWQEASAVGSVLSAAGWDLEAETLTSIKPRSDVVDYIVREGDTVSTIAEKFGVSIDTIRWQNKLKSVKDIKLGQALQILPVTGIAHKVQRGDTVYSLAKRYSASAQAIVDWPFNSFSNDETFELAVGQTLIIPDGVMPKEQPVAPMQYLAQTPGAGTLSGTGQFIWPTQGRITQNFRWYHKAIDIADRIGPAVLAADSGTVFVAGWVSPVAYGNRVMIDHHNGLVTLYGHLAEIYVTPGQNVTRGQTIGKMGSTGRSTGTHLHFEIRQNGVAQDPMAYLK